MIIGPYFKSFQEAETLVNLGGIFSVKNKSELTNIYNYLSFNDEVRKNAGIINGKYVSNSIGASFRIVNKIKETH